MLITKQRFSKQKAAVGLGLYGCCMLLATVAVSSHTLAANNDQQPHFTFSGFGTLGAVHSNQDQADFVGTFFQPDGAGYSRSWATTVDTKLGLQLDAYYNDKLSAVVQGVILYDYDGSYVPQFEWAYINYKLTPDFTLRLGRVVSATFMESETRLIGYTYPWMRPPQELYALNPTTNKDGIDLLYRFYTGAAVHTLQASYGEKPRKFANGGEADVKNAWDSQYILDIGDTSFRIGYMTFVLAYVGTPDTDTLFDGLAVFGEAVPGPSGAEAALSEQQFRFIDSRYSVYALGVKHNPGNWLMRAEWGKVNAEAPTFASDETAWYATVGYRFGSLTPFITVAKVKPDKLTRHHIPTDGLPPELAQSATALDAGLDAVVNSFAFSQERIAAGVRWDAWPQIAIKAQYEHLRTDDGSNGRLTNTQPGFTSGDEADVFSFAVDFVF